MTPGIGRKKLRFVSIAKIIVLFGNLMVEL
jgi:hypothetical protein